MKERVFVRRCVLLSLICFISLFAVAPSGAQATLGDGGAIASTPLSMPVPASASAADVGGPTVLKRVSPHTQAPMVTTLENGLMVVIKEQHAAPVVALNVWVHVGARNEARGQEGYAHLLEHMMFKGTSRFKVGELDRAIKKMGATNNAFTAADYTCYHVFGAAEYFPRFADLLADATLNSVLDPVEFAKEKQVVIEELRMDNDDPQSANFNALKELAYTTHPYRHPIVGYLSSLQVTDRNMLYAFYRKYYVPANMVVVVVGNVKAAEALAEIRKCFGSALKQPAPLQDVPAEPRQVARREVLQNGEVNQAYVNLAWHVPGITSPDNTVLDVISALLGTGRSSRLFQAVVEQDRLATTIDASYYTGQDPSLFLVMAQAQQSKVRELIDRASVVVYKLRHEPIPAEELEKAKQQIISTTLFSRESADNLAQTYGHYATLGYLDEADAYLDHIKAVTADDVKRVANEYFRDANLTVARYEPMLASATQTPEMITLDNGLRLILKENHAAPIIAVTAMVDAGGLREDKKQAGLANLMATTILKGTEKMKAEEIARTFESLGARVDVKAYKTYTALSVAALAEKFMTALELAVTCLTEPSFPATEVEKERRRAIEAIRAQEDDLFAYTLSKTLAGLFPDTPLAYPSLGLVDQVEKLDRADVVGFHKKQLAADGMVIAVVGDFYINELKKPLIELFSKIPKGKAAAKPELDLEELAAPVIVENRKDKEQAQILFATRSFPRTDARFPALLVLRGILSGSMSSRLFTNLRDKESLAYSVWASVAAFPNTGYFYATLSTEAKKQENATRRLLQELEQVVKAGFSPDELDEAKQYIIGQYALDQVTNEQQAEMFATDEYFGLGFDHYKKYPTMIKDVTAEQVRAVANDVLPVEVPVGASDTASFKRKFVLGITKP